MNFNDLKKLCKDHERLLKKTEIIQRCEKARIWMKVTNPNYEEFSLGDDEIKLLRDFYSKKGLEIESKIYEILNKNEGVVIDG